MSDQQTTSSSNLLLRTLGAEDLARLQPHLEPVTLGFREPLYEAGKRIAFAHFLEDGVASVTDPQADGDEVEVGLYGYEGFSGIPLVLGVDCTPHRSFIQVGDGLPALRIAAEPLVEACNQSLGIRTLLLRHVHTFAVQAAQGSAANAHFEVTERLARWLLMCHDRVMGDVLELTHEFMATMLGVRRAGVTVALHTLEGTGAIRATRGRITVLDRERLHHLAADCYGKPEAEYSRLIAPFGRGANGG
jgi:CRP-like cAMP-binding protein